MKKSILIASFCFLGLGAFAQPNEGNPNFSPTPLAGIGLLIAAGAALGGRKAYQSWQDRNEE